MQNVMQKDSQDIPPALHSFFQEIYQRLSSLSWQRDDARTQRPVRLLMGAIVALSVVLGALPGCQRDQTWKSHEFKEAGLRFSLPENWSARLLLPGKSPQDLATASRENSARSGAVVTALSQLEDAAVVFIATEERVDMAPFARHMKKFIPLDDIRFTPDKKLVSVDLQGIQGYRGQGVGRLPNNGPEVHFRCFALDISGQPVFAILYAEETQRERYKSIFDKIVESLEPGSSSKTYRTPKTSSPKQKASLDPAPLGSAPRGSARGDLAPPAGAAP